MDDKEGCQETVSEIYASGVTWWLYKCVCVCGLVSLFNGLYNGLFKAKAIHKIEPQWWYLTPN